jgi:hypothetical protein
MVEGYMLHHRRCEKKLTGVSCWSFSTEYFFVSALVSILVFSSLIADYQASEQHYYDPRDSREYRSQGRGNYSRGKASRLIYMDLLCN